jgi:DNA/RNA-binding domain of Phe-tRNA-synthetase-like protein
MKIIASDAWKKAHPGARVGVLLVEGAANPSAHPALEARKAEVVRGLRERFAASDRSALSALPSIAPYIAYYDRFKKTYHVLLQLESVVFKGRDLPNTPGLVSAMFIAELKNQLLTAGHDADALREPLTLDVAAGDETYTLLNSQPQTLKPGDMYMRDAEGVISSIIYGPDGRTRLAPSSTGAVYVVYGPPGISAQMVAAHFDDLLETVRLFAPGAKEAQRLIFEA